MNERETLAIIAALVIICCAGFITCNSYHTTSTYQHQRPVRTYCITVDETGAGFLNPGVK